MEISGRKIVHRFGTTALSASLISLWLLVGACETKKDVKVPYYNDATFTPVWKVTTSQLDTLHTIGSFNFINQYGSGVSERTFRGKIYLANFFFTSCPSICPKMTNTMKQVFDKFKENDKIMFLSHSVTPDIDSVARLYQYAQSNHILHKQWQLITGNAASIYNIARKGYFIEEEIGLSKDSTEFLHTENFVLVDTKGHIRGLYNGTLPAEVPRISEDITELLKEYPD